MIDAYLSVLMDLIVLVFLGATIFYVLRLSVSLNEFKAQRREFDNVITNMISSIDQAERTVHSLKQTGAQEAAELEKLVGESKALAEELKIINEASESMAKRLENLAETNRKAVQSSQGYTNDDSTYTRPKAKSTASRRINRLSTFGDKASKAEEEKISSPVYKKEEPKPPAEDKRDFQSTLRKVSGDKKERKDDDKGFSEDKIPSFMIKDKDFDPESISEDDAPDALQSQAEKELFEALRGSKKNIGNGA
jgi:chromosome segregation ATPase